MRAFFLVALGLCLAFPLAAQGGVSLGLTYNTDELPGLVVLPLDGAPEIQDAALLVRTILRDDLERSDRVQVLALEAKGGGARDKVAADQWRAGGVDWLVRGELRTRTGGLVLYVQLYDVIYDQPRGSASFLLPSASSRDFRMSVHSVSDQIVRWMTSQAGMAASRIVFTRRVDGHKEVYIVDSDGQNLARVTKEESIVMSPTWSPSGRYVAYTSYRNHAPHLYEHDLATGRSRLLSDRAGLNITPAYSPDGRMLAFASSQDGNTEVFTYDRERMCCIQQRTQGRRSDALSPTFSPDGRSFAFVSNRLGEPHIYIMGLGESQARMLSEYSYGQRSYNTSPDWSPAGPHIAYHSRRSGVHQLVEVSVESGEQRLLTDRFTNEDPSWAPDGRHLVFTSPDREGGGLFVLDSVTGKVRRLVAGKGISLPDWSPSLARTVLEAAPR